MAVTYVQSGAQRAASTTNTSVTLTGVTAGNLVVVELQWAMASGTATLSSVSDGTNTYTISSGSLADQTATHYSHLYTQYAYATASGTGSLTITGTVSASAAAIHMTCYEITAGVIDQVGPATGNSATPTSASVTTGGNGAFAIAGGILDDGFGFGSGWFTAGSGWTIRMESGGGNENAYSEGQAQTSAGSIQGTCTSGFPGVTGPWAASIITFIPAGGGGGGATVTYWPGAMTMGLG